MSYKNFGIYPITLFSRVNYIPAESLYKGENCLADDSKETPSNIYVYNIFMVNLISTKK